MVTVLRKHGMRFVIYTADHEPPHAHVYGDGEARIDIVTLKVITQGGLSDRDVEGQSKKSARTRRSFWTRGDSIMVEITDADLEIAKLRWVEERAARPIPSAVRFDRDSERIIVDFTNGAAFLIPARALEGLEQASPDQFAEVELLGETGLHWETLDVDYTIQGLMAGLFGSRAFLEAQRRGGQSRSPAKIAASRVNGAKGGRPRKITG